MIPNFYPPFDDENIVFWVQNIAELNFMSGKEFCETYYTDRNFLEYGKGKDWIRNIDQACSEFEPYLPDAIDILRNKTLYYTMLPFMSLRGQAVLAEYILRSRPSPVIPDELLPRVSNFYVCPLCAKEDLVIHKRVIVHTPHMLPSVTCCHKHGVRLIPFKSLTSERPIAASASEIKTAVFMYCLYNSPLFIDWDVTRAAVKDELKRQGTTYTDFINTYTELFKEEKFSISSLLQMFQKVQDEHFYMVRIASALFKDFSSFFDRVSDKQLYSGEFRDNFIHSIRFGYDLISDFGPIVKLRCKQCGTEFHIHPMGCLMGMICPKCDMNSSDKEIIGRYVQNLEDGKYSMEKGPDGKYIFTHLPCGSKTIVRDFRNILRYGIKKCKKCQKNEKIGEERFDEKGRKMILAAFRNAKDVDILIDGKLMKHKLYKRFLQGKVGGNLKAPRHKLQVGDETVTKDGHHLKVVAYHSRKDVDVLVDSQVLLEKRGKKWFDHASEIILGNSIQYKRKNYIGKKAIWKDGQIATFEKYNSPADVEIRLENGERLHISYKTFSRLLPYDESLHVKKINRDKTGEVFVTLDGHKLEIVAFINKNIIDVLVDDKYLLHKLRYKAIHEGIYIERNKEYISQVHIGETRTFDDGKTVKIIAYRSCRDIDVELDDGRRKNNIWYCEFLNKKAPFFEHPSTMNHDELIGMETITKDNHRVRIIAVRSLYDIDVIVDETHLLHHWSYKRFVNKNGLFSDNDYLRCIRMGETFVTKEGKRGTITGYRTANDLDVLFDDGTSLQHVAYSSLKNCFLRKRIE